MANFAELDENNVVVNVIVVDDKDTSDANGNEQEEIGLAFLKNLFPEKKFVKTSRSGSIRNTLASIGGTYDPQLDKFFLPKPYPSWILNSDKTAWTAPTPLPDESGWSWNEETKTWDAFVSKSSQTE